VAVLELAFSESGFRRDRPMNMDRVGLDVGFGIVKSAIIRDGELKTDSFPSLIGQKQELARYRVLGERRRRAIGMVETLRDDCVPHFNDAEYLFIQTSLNRALVMSALIPVSDHEPEEVLDKGVTIT
jgi:hypothetical protein